MILFDGRRVDLVTDPQFAGASVGWWADVREALNATDPGPNVILEYGPIERVSLSGARDLLAEVLARAPVDGPPEVAS